MTITGGVRDENGNECVGWVDGSATQTDVIMYSALSHMKIGEKTYKIKERIIDESNDECTFILREDVIW